MKRLSAALAAVAVASAVTVGLTVTTNLHAEPHAAAAPAPHAAEPAWVAGWTAAASGPAPDSAAGYAFTRNDRAILRVTVSGTSVRVRVSNEFGTAAMPLARVTVGIALGDGPGVVAGTMRALTWSGATGATVQPGRTALSDPVALTVNAGDKLAVSVRPSATVTNVTWHGVSRQQVWVATNGDRTLEESGINYTSNTQGWRYVDEVDVLADAGSAIAAVGDSITDGLGSATNSDTRWSDDLSRRLGDPRPVINLGISSGRLMTDSGGQVTDAGPSTLNRLGDILGRAGVGSVVVHEGVNDLRLNPPRAANQIEDSLSQIVAVAHARGIRVTCTTILPYNGASFWDATREGFRNTVNNWIRAGLCGDAFADFDAAVRSATDPTRLNAAFDSGDHIHPNAAGYTSMANTIDVASL